MTEPHSIFFLRALQLSNCLSFKYKLPASVDIWTCTKILTTTLRGKNEYERWKSCTTVIEINDNLIYFLQYKNRVDSMNSTLEDLSEMWS